MGLDENFPLTDQSEVGVRRFLDMGLTEVDGVDGFGTTRRIEQQIHFLGHGCADQEIGLGIAVPVIRLIRRGDGRITPEVAGIDNRHISLELRIDGEIFHRQLGSHQ